MGGLCYNWHVKARQLGRGEMVGATTWSFPVKLGAPQLERSIPLRCHLQPPWTDNSGTRRAPRIYRNGSEVGQVGMNVTPTRTQALNENHTYPTM